MFYKNNSLSVEVYSLAEFLVDKISGAKAIQVLAEGTSCKVRLKFHEDMSNSEIIDCVKKSLGFEIEDIDDYMIYNSCNVIELSIAEFKKPIEEIYEVELTEACLVDEENSVIYFFY